MTFSIDHLLFADDLVIFCNADYKKVINLKSRLDLYCSWTGQQVNLDNSKVLFSSNLDGRLKGTIKRILHLNKVKNDVIYLGNPMYFGRSKCRTFNYIKEKVASQFASSRNKLLSQTGRFTLTKFIDFSPPSSFTFLLFGCYGQKISLDKCC